jgi:GT2 family glycosyltransferase
MPKFFRIYTIIVTYNGTKWIDKCFGSLTTSNIPVKIIAVDNKSTDGTPEKIKQKYPSVQVVETGQNLGFGKANNVGIRIAYQNNADYIFLLNQDAWVEKDTITNLINTHQKNPSFDLISPLQLNGAGDAIDRNFQNYLSPFQTPHILSDAVLGKLAPIYESSYANAAAWFLTAEAIKQVGGFDPLFKHYGEDDDYINRLHQKGLKLAVDTTSIIYHDRPQNGKLHEKFYQNHTYTQALLSVKSTTTPRRHFLIRRIFVNWISLMVLSFGKDEEVKRNIKRDVLAIKLMRKAREHKAIQQNTLAHL